MDLHPFVANLGMIYEHSPWIAEAVWRERPFASADALSAAMARSLGWCGSTAHADSRASGSPAARWRARN
jgi:2-oxo-4-hydroxy-4-carboxy-5-ureidoimidazoline decarboxylase